MPTEFRFDDLDLREEPPSGTKTDDYTSFPAVVAGNDAATVTCTRVCCV